MPLPDQEQLFFFGVVLGICVLSLVIAGLVIAFMVGVVLGIGPH